MDSYLECIRRLLEESNGKILDEETYARLVALLDNISEDGKNSISDIDYKEIVDKLPFGLGIVSGDGLYLYCNQAYTDETGIKPEFVLGRYVQDIAKEGVFFCNPSSMQILKSGQIVSTVSTDNVFGQHKVSYTVGVPIFDQNGDIKYAVTSMFNTEIMRNYYNEFRNSQKKIDSVRIINNSDAVSEENMVGHNVNMEKIRQLIQKAAPTDATILIGGESGVGKELVANYIYECSNRKDKPYVKINCAAIPVNLLESELFGYEKGAFTGASNKGKVGLLEVADGGTVLLDEVGELPLDLQPKLLRFLQQGTIYRVGGNTSKKINVRVIAATNVDLKQSIKDGTFREDLYYRISVFPITVPPLRARVDDIREIADYYFQYYCKKYNKTVEISDYLYPILEDYDWPGNIRELQNIIEYSVICCDDGEEIEPIYFQSLFRRDELASTGMESMTLYEMRCQYEKGVISNAMRHCSSLRETAKVLGLAPSSLLRKIRKYGIDANSFLKGGL